MLHRLLPPRRPPPGSVVGVLVCAAVAGVATGLGRAVPLIGAPVIGLLLGAIIALVRRPSTRLRPGIAFCSHQVLQVAVAALGLQLTLGHRGGRGRTVAARPGRHPGDLPGRRGRGGEPAQGAVGAAHLVGVGTAICGASAIAALTPIIDAAAADVAYALSTVFVFNAVAVVVFPLVGHGPGDVASRRSGCSPAPPSTTPRRSWPLAPSTARRRDSTPSSSSSRGRCSSSRSASASRCGAVDGRAAPDRCRRVTHLVPWFLVAFVAASALVSAVPPSTARARRAAARRPSSSSPWPWSAIGLTTDLRGLRHTGPRPLLLGAILWVVVSASSLLLAAATGIR